MLSAKRCTGRRASTRNCKTRSAFMSAIINGVLAPFLLVGILLSARDPLVMKKQPSSVPAQAIVALTTVAMFVAAGVMFWGTLQGG